MRIFTSIFRSDSENTFRRHLSSQSSPQECHIFNNLVIFEISSKMPNEILGVMTLVKFDGPFLVHKDQKKDFKDDPYFCKSTNIATLSWNPDPNAIALCQETLTSQKGIEEVLNAIQPPMIWEEDGKTWRQVVSLETASRADVIYLNRELDHRLLIRQARTEGICLIRRELYAQAFDELIRQVTTNCPERGLVLLRIRDEMKMTIKSYQALNDASSAFGLLKRPGIETHLRLQRKLGRIDTNRKLLQKEHRELTEELELVRRTFDEQKQSDDKRHFEQVQFLKRVNQLLRQKFDGIMKIKMEETEES